MKKLMMLSVGIFCALSLSASILIVDNNPSAPAQYSSISFAISAASIGDTIYIQPSSTSYGTFTLNKKLILIGGGANPIKQNNTPTKNSGIQLDKGSDGTIIMGFLIDGSYGIKAISDSLTNILIANCHIYRTITTGKGISNWIVEGCVFSEGYAMDIGSGSNILFQNNVCSAAGAGAASGALYFQSNFISNFIVRNNTWIGKGGSYPILTYNNNISTLVIENNIFYLNSFVFTYFNGCQWNNNCFYLTNTWIGNSGTNSGNIQNNPQFVNFPATGDYFKYSYDFHLTTGSACIGAGLGGTNIGAYGGSMRFNPGIQPPVPQITSIKLKNSAVPAGGKLYFEAVIEKQK